MNSNSNSNNIDLHLISYYIGIFIVFSSHIYMLYNHSQDTMLRNHSIINLVGALMIAYYFTNKEGMIQF